MRRLAATVILAAAILFGGAPTVGAAETIGWWLTASGSAHCTRDANHVVCVRYDRAGWYQGAVIDFWLPWYCVLGHVVAGDNAGAPLRLTFRSPVSSGQGCIGNGQSSWQGWGDGYGWLEGQNYWSPAYVVEDTVYIFPRDTATPAALGTQVAIY